MISLYRYQLPFSKPFITGSNRYAHREGVLIRYLSNSGDLWAEASPLPGFSLESFHDVSTTLANRLPALNHFLTSDYELSELKDWLNIMPSSPSIQFALSYLGLRILALRRQIRPSSFFDLDFSDKVQVNDVIGVDEPETLRRRIRDARHQGFTTFKCKAGEHPEDLAATLSELTLEQTDIQLRVDANQSWPADRLKNYGDLFRNLPIEYVEEPSPYHSEKDLRHNMSTLQLPMALDESVRSFEGLKKIKSEFPSLYIVIKPALYGNIFKIEETISTLQSKRKNMVFSTLLESKVGRDMVLFCAALMGDPDLAQGLNTGQIFKNDLQPDFKIRNGFIETDTHFMSSGEPIQFHYLNALNGIHS